MKTGTKAERKAAEAIMSKAEAIVECSVAAIKEATQQPNVTPNGTPENKVQKTSYVVDDKGLNKYGVEGTVLFAAGQALARKKITQDGYRAVCQAEWSLDEAVAAKLLGDAVAIDEEQNVTEKPKKATANPDKKRKTQPKKEKTPKETTPPAGWTIEVLDDAGDTLETVSSDIPRKEILVKFGGSSMSEARKNVANDKGKRVRFTNNKTEKVYVSKPK